MNFGIRNLHVGQDEGFDEGAIGRSNDRILQDSILNGYRVFNYGMVLSIKSNVELSCQFRNSVDVSCP